jgi:hypothetical protein
LKTVGLAAGALVAGSIVAPMLSQAATIESGTYYNLVNRNSGKLLDVADCSTADAATVRQWSSTNADCQQFRFESAGSGYWRIVAKHSGKAIDLWEWNTGDGADFKQWPISDGYNQQYSVSTSGDYVSFKNRHSGKTLEIWEWSTADGGRLSQFSATGGANQQWKLVKAGSSGGGSTTTTKTSSGGGSSGGNGSGSWPSSAGSVKVSGTIKVSGTLDGGMKTYCCIGDGGQSESQDAMFEIANGGTLKNVIIGSPAGDGVHCLGTCTIQNVWWNDVGEDAATFLGTSGGTSYVTGGGAKNGSDKLFQHNGNGTVNISNFYAETAGKLYRGCGNCTNSYQRHVVINGVTTKSVKVLAGINTNWGDTARFSNVTILGSSSSVDICVKYKGVSKGNEPTKIGSGADGKNCIYSSSDITYK